VSPVLGFLLAFVVYKALARIVRDRRAFAAPQNGQPPPLWMRLLLVLTCTGVSFSHGTNDGQKSIGLIMLTVIGLMPSDYALNPSLSEAKIHEIAGRMPAAIDLIGRGGDSRKQQGIDNANALRARFTNLKSPADIPDAERSSVRNNFSHVLAALRAAENSPELSEADRKKAKAMHDDIMRSVEYAPWWVRILSAVCLGAGTMIGYRRIVKTLGERLGREHLVPAQGASAELVAAGLIGSAGFTGYPVSTTHVVTGGIAGTMIASGAGVHHTTVRRIVWAWVLTLPGTVALSALLFYLIS
jgi:PiT family inorganic phosphate transporter